MEIKTKIQKFLFMKGFNPARSRTKVLAETMYVVIQRLGNTEINNLTIIQQVGYNLSIPVNNVIQHLFQCKNSLEKLLKVSINETPQEVAINLTYEFLNISGDDFV